MNIKSSTQREEQGKESQDFLSYFSNVDEGYPDTNISPDSNMSSNGSTPTTTQRLPFEAEEDGEREQGRNEEVLLSPLSDIHKSLDMDFERPRSA